jgi:hypothetical protein
MAETKLKAAPISPINAPAKSGASNTHTVAFTAPARNPEAGIAPRWVDGAHRLMRKFRYADSGDQIAPFLEEAEADFPAMVEEVSATAGQCGPIARRMLAGSAMISATGFFLMSRAQRHEDSASREAVTLAKTGAQFLEASSRMASAALEQAVRIARTTPAGGSADPLAAFREAAAARTVDAEDPPDEA